VRRGLELQKTSFGHGAVAPISDGRCLLGSYHVSQQNTFTGKLTANMFDKVLAQCKEAAGVERW
jgi:uracil-DNA glycosylase